MRNALPKDSLRVLNVGQCGFDHSSIARYLTDRFGASVERPDSLDEVHQALRSSSFDLVLVNRVLDLDGSSGLELIETLKNDPEESLKDTPVMLVSDYDEAQRMAVALGAEPGFGKSEMRSSTTFERLRALLG
jgi:two-component system chemotaxis response regulator CheY